MDHAHLEIASGILNIVLATVDLVGVAHDTTVWFDVCSKCCGYDFSNTDEL